MANKTVTVKSSGGDYTSLNAALAGESTNLVSTLDGILTIECYAMGDTTAVDTGTGYTTDADHYISILTPAAERHPGKWDSNKYYLSLGPGYGVGIITIREAYVRIVGLQIENTKAQNDSPIGIRLNVGTTTSDIRIQSNLIVATGATTNHESAIGILISGDVTARIGNNVVWNFATSVLYSSYVAQNIYLYANTIIGVNSSNYGENLQGSGTYKYRDNIIQNCATCFGINMDGGLDDSSYNISSDDTSPQSGLRSLTVSFVDSTNATIRSRDYHLAAADTAAKDAGESLASDTDFALSVDIDGDTRTNDIGADEYVAAGASVTLTMSSCVQKNTTTGLLVPIEAYMSTASGIQKNVTTSFPLSAEIAAAVASGIQKNIAGTFEIPIEITTDPANCVQRNVADTPSILAELICEAISGIQKNITEVPNIAVEITLDTASGVQKNVAGVITLVVEGAGEEVTLTVYSGVQRNFVDTFTIPIEASVTTASGIQRNASNTPDAILESILTVINSVQKNVGDVISDLPTQITVTVNDGVQKNIADAVTMPVEFSMTLADGVQKNIGDAVSLDIEALLAVIDGIQKNVAGTLTLSVSAAGDVLARILRVISKSQQRTFTIKTQRTIKTKGTKSIELIVD